MKKCRELLKYNNLTLVEVRNEDDKLIEYVVCSNFDNAKAWGNKWDQGKYFTVNSSYNNPEETLKDATMSLYGIDKRAISYERTTDLMMAFLDEIKSDYEQENLVKILNDADVTETEADFLGVKELLYPSMFKLVEVTMKREQYTTIKLVMPNDEDNWSANEYIDNTVYLDEQDSFDEGEWEVDDVYVIDTDITREDFKKGNDRYDTWNAEDIDEI